MGSSPYIILKVSMNNASRLPLSLMAFHDLLIDCDLNLERQWVSKDRVSKYQVKMK